MAFDSQKVIVLDKETGGLLGEGLAKDGLYELCLEKEEGARWF